ncbi:PTS sugar transporter subunit IIB [Neobacillus drentensis]|uniref:PTS sugar transporter subunit IIB n=1 Tax=Neobacillus drentensis TaxID=220684 RepID=UPI001F17237D|nr:PTS sugar transporter subunit IIB [Neobacillus drentensis]ULT59575.1 PTS sugar transporter subunit IIB [Neobacillus drentensis]
MISLVRVDDRLVHGMVAVSWTSALKPDCILVANDAASKDAFMSMTMKMAKPAGVSLIIKTIEESISILNSEKYKSKKFFVVTESVEDAYKVSEQVDGIKTVNIGTAGLKKKEKLISTLPQIKMTIEDFEYARKLHEKGIDVFAQVTPSLERMNYEGILKAFQTI